jgi:hypothetical protein
MRRGLQPGALADSGGCPPGVGQCKIPFIWPIHPARRGGVSDIARVSRGVVTGFGIFGYYLALRGVRELLAAK